MMSFLFHHKKLGGFTLIEMMVVLAILGLVVTLYIPNLQRQQVRTRLKSARNEIRAELEKVATWSTAVRAGTDISGDAYNHQLVGYAMRFTVGSAEYTLWEVWANETDQIGTFAQTPAARKTKGTLAKAILISEITPSQPTAGVLDVVFTTPTGRLNETFSTLDSEGKVVLNFASKGYTESLSIWRNGRAS